MTFTINLGTWVFPATLTVIGILVLMFSSYRERNDSGWLSGFGTFLVSLAVIPSIIACWVMWAIMYFLK